MSDILERERLSKAYQNVMMNESKTGIRRKLQILDDNIDDFMDFLEKKATNIDDNPVFQQKVFQMIADATKEHSEFLMAMKRVASTLDSGSQVVPKTKGSMQFKSNVNPYEPGEEEPDLKDLPPAESPPGQEPSNEALLEAINMKNIKYLQSAMDKVQRAVETKVSMLGGKDLAMGASLATQLQNARDNYLATSIKLEKLVK